MLSNGCPVRSISLQVSPTSSCFCSDVNPMCKSPSIKAAEISDGLSNVRQHTNSSLQDDAGGGLGFGVGVADGFGFLVSASRAPTEKGINERSERAIKALYNFISRGVRLFSGRGRDRASESSFSIHSPHLMISLKEHTSGFEQCSTAITTFGIITGIYPEL